MFLVDYLLNVLPVLNESCGNVDLSKAGLSWTSVVAVQFINYNGKDLIVTVTGCICITILLLVLIGFICLQFLLLLQKAKPV